MLPASYGSDIKLTIQGDNRGSEIFDLIADDYLDHLLLWSLCSMPHSNPLHEVPCRPRDCFVTVLMIFWVLEKCSLPFDLWRKCIC